MGAGDWSFFSARDNGRKRWAHEEKSAFSGRVSVQYRNSVQNRNFLFLRLLSREPAHVQSCLPLLLFTQVFFQDVFAEPDGSHSIDGVWQASFTTFVATKYWCYRIITALCGIPTAILCGIYFACLSFDYIWCIMPCLKAYTIELQCLGKLFSLCVRTFFDPFFESVGRIFGGVRVEHKRFTA